MAFRKSRAEIYRNMSAIRSTDTKIEVQLRSRLWRMGYRFRKNDKRFPGKPDIVFPKEKIAVFCDSDFWHGRDWDTLRQRLTTNHTYWVPKIERNRERDIGVTRELEDRGWIVLRFWESDIKKNIDEIICSIAQVIENARSKLDSGTKS